MPFQQQSMNSSEITLYQGSGIIMCQGGSGFAACPWRNHAAVTLLTSAGARRACCDTCARRVYNIAPDLYRIRPLSEWYDLYEDAKAQAAVSWTCEVTSQPAQPGAAKALPAAPDAQQEAAAPVPGSSTYQSRHAGQGLSQRERKARRLLAALAIAAVTCEILGIALIAEGTHLEALGAANPDGPYNPGWWWFGGILVMLLPFIAGAICVLAAIARAAAAGHQRYRAWKATLTPEQRTAVELAEAAALTTAAIAWHEHNERRDAELTSSVMGYTMPDGHTMRPLDRIAAYRQQAALRYPAQQQLPPAGHTQAVTKLPESRLSGIAGAGAPPGPPQRYAPSSSASAGPSPAAP